jgi:peptidoglycan/LPS O-acetylase OafA/YrhL
MTAAGGGTRSLGDSTFSDHAIRYRPDIDGLRAVAVILVILVHAAPNWVQNGFIGVDIFFVISGFLITGILLTNLKDGSFSLKDFYVRRANRIFPALILVLITCTAFGWVSLYAGEFKLLGRSIATGAGFVANVGFYFESGYWDIAAKLKPLLHLWSLGVEEQYYLFWPLMLWAAWTRRVNIAVLFLVLIASSLVWNLWSITTDQAATFYLPFARFWELSAGGALAYANTVLPVRRDNALLNFFHRFANRYHGSSLPAVLSNLSALLGLSLIMYALTSSFPAAEFPGWRAILPVVGTVLVIAAGSRSWLNAKLLSQRFLVYIGLISFPLYLWHWPLLTFPRILNNGELPDTFRNAALALTLLLAVATYHLLEKPIRQNRSRRGLIAVSACAFLVVSGAAGYAIYVKDGLSARYGNSNSIALENQPEINKTRKVAILGDSNAGVLSFGLAAVYHERLVGTATASWPNLSGVTFNRGFTAHSPDATPQATEQALAKIASDRSVDTVVISHSSFAWLVQDSLRSYPESAPDETSALAYEAGLRRTVKMMTDAGKAVVYVKSIPFLYSVPLVEACFSTALPVSRKQPSQCVTPFANVQEHQKEYSAVVSRALKDLPLVSVFETLPYLCDENYCYVEKNGLLMYRDAGHLSELASLLVGFDVVRLVERQHRLAEAKANAP